MRRRAETGFLVCASDIRNDIYIPRYYDPRVEDELKALEGFDLAPLGKLVAAGDVEHTHGDYVPKMHYGTGPYPYVRSSDFANWELTAIMHGDGSRRGWWDDGKHRRAQVRAWGKRGVGGVGG